MLKMTDKMTPIKTQRYKVKVGYPASFFLAAFIFACSQGPQKFSDDIKRNVQALYETTPMPQHKKDDAADDPAIWVHPPDPAKSRIIGTDKKGGLVVYNLKGEQLFYYPDGEMNNVDVRYGFPLGTDTIDLACASNRTTRSIAVYRINPDGSLANIASRVIRSEMQEEVYGFCLYKSPVSGKTFAFINSKAGEVEQWELLASGQLIDASLVRSLRLNTQVEGMVADDEFQSLYVGEETAGIWKFDAEPDGGRDGVKLEKSPEEDNPNIRYDIEGLAVYCLPDSGGYLVASSQGNYSYAVFDRQEPHTYRGSFRIGDGKVDGVEETDGLEIYSYGLNADFRHGLLVVQDGYNYDGKKYQPQNFKLVRWEDIASQFDPPLKINE
jgi:3-phytase